MSSEAILRQSHQETSALLAQRDKDILQLRSQLQQQQIQLQQQSEPISIHPPSAKQTNFKVITSLYPKQKPRLEFIKRFAFFFLV